MLQSNPLAKIKTALAREQQRIDALKYLQSLAESDPSFLAEIMQELAGSANQANGAFTVNSGRSSALGATASTVYNRMREFYLANENRPASIVAIAKQTGIKKASIANTVYRARSECFEQAGKNGRTVLWRMKKGGDALSS